MSDWLIQAQHIMTGAKVDVVVRDAPNAADARLFVAEQGYRIVSIDAIAGGAAPEHAIVQQFVGPPTRGAMSDADMLRALVNSSLVQHPVATIALGVFFGAAAWFLVSWIVAEALTRGRGGH